MALGGVGHLRIPTAVKMKLERLIQHDKNLLEVFSISKKDNEGITEENVGVIDHVNTAYWDVLNVLIETELEHYE